ncbi:MAG: hypothetical protein Q8L39_10875 [Burkholderiales bacterium]|nr:hypothetical protein [Burkholderiales bacterium]
MKLGKITTYAMARMKQRGISLATLRYLLAHGRVERKCDGARLVYLEHTPPSPSRTGAPSRTLYALVDREGEVITVERRVRRDFNHGALH